MYIELFLLDNILMNMLILRLACAIRSCRPKTWMILAFSLFGAIYAMFCVMYSWLGIAPFKLAVGCIMALSLRDRSMKAYLLSVGALFLSTFSIGGLSLAAVYAFGGSIVNGSLYAPARVRIALLAAVAAMFLPGLIRRLLARRLSATVDLRIKHAGCTYMFKGVVDSGNLLCEPVTGLPVIVIYAPALKAHAAIPVSYNTVDGAGILYAFRPDRIEIGRGSGYALVDASVAISDRPLQYALIPPSVVCV